MCPVRLCIYIPQTVLALRGPGGEKEMSGGAGTPPESAGGVSRPKMCIWRSGGPKSIGKQVVPMSPPHYSVGNIAIFGIHRLPTRSRSTACLNPRHTHQTACLNLRNTHKINEKSIFLWCDCRKFTFLNEKHNILVPN